jgi:hypothetical protein
MRVYGLLFLLACGSPRPQPAKPDRTSEACRDLSSSDVDVRVKATRELVPKTGSVEGGTEQQMDAARAYCAKTFGPAAPESEPDRYDPDELKRCFDACFAQRVKAGESQSSSESDCMQNCNKGE